jgi:hypothetical protein
MRRTLFVFATLFFLIAIASPLRFAYAAAPQTDPLAGARDAIESIVQSLTPPPLTHPNLRLRSAPNAADAKASSVIVAASQSALHTLTYALSQAASAWSAWVALANSDLISPVKIAAVPSTASIIVSQTGANAPPISAIRSALPTPHLFPLAGASSRQPIPTPFHAAAQGAVLGTSTQVSYVTQDELAAQIEQATNALRTLIYQNESVPNSLPASGGYTNNIAVSNAIDQLNGTTLTNVTVNGVSGLTAAEIPTDIVAANYLPLTGGTLTGAFADIATASSSFSGALGVGTSSPTDTLSVSGPIFLANVTPAATSNRLYSNAGSLYWAGSLIGGGSVGNWSTDGTNVWRAGGNVGIGTTSPLSALAVSGGTSIGADYDLAAPTNGLIVEGNVGIGTSTPFTQLTVTPAAATPTRFSSNTLNGTGQGIYVQGRYAYLSDYGTPNNFEIWDISNPSAPVRVSSNTLNTNGDNIYVQGRYAYLADDGTTNAFEIWDISNPSAPVRVSQNTLNTAGSGIYVQGRYAYLADDGTTNAFEIWDISNPSAPVRVSSNTLNATARSVYVQGRYAYLADDGTTNAFEIWDISNPSAPVRVSSNTLNANGFGVYVQGRYAYIADAGTTNAFEVWDISNPSAPVRVSSNTLNTNGDNIYVQGRYAYLADRGAATNAFELWDVSNPSAPVRISSNTLNVSARDVYVQGRYAYIAEGGTTNAFEIWDLGGGYIQQLETGGLETGTLSVRNNLQALDGAFAGGLTVGQSLMVTGSGSFVSTASTFNTTANIFNITTASSTGPIFNVLGNGNVGIGGSSPQHALDVYGDCIAYNGTCINTSAPANVVSYVGTTFKFSANANFSTASATRYLGAANTAVNSSDVARVVVTRAGTLQNLYIKASANTFSGTVTFTVMKNGSNTALTAQLTGSGVTTASDTTHSVSVAAGDVLALSMVTSAGSGTITAPFEASFEELVTTNVFSSQWVTSGSSISYATTSETVGIGTTTPYAALEVWGPDAASSTLAFNVVNSASTTVFAVFDGGNAELSGTLTQSSDQRLKTNIQSLDASSSLALIDQLNPVTFDWIDPDEGATPQVGFIAQQVQAIFPELVSTTSPTALTPGGTLGLNYIGLISPIVSAIQALYSDVLSLEQTVSGFAESFASNVITANQQLCVKQSDGTPVCITGDQLAALLASQDTGSNQSPAVAQPSPSGGSNPPESVTQNSASTTPTTPPTITINGDNPAIIQVGDSYADLGATVTDTGPGQAGDANLGYETFLNGTLVSNIVIDTSQVATDTIDYVATDEDGLTSTSTRTVLIEASPSIVPADDASTTAATTAQ